MNNQTNKLSHKEKQVKIIIDYKMTIIVNLDLFYTPKFSTNLEINSINQEKTLDNIWEFNYHLIIYKKKEKYDNLNY